MSTFIGFESGLQYLLSNGLDGSRSSYYLSKRTSLMPTKAQPQHGIAPKPSKIRQLGFPLGIQDNALHICVADLTTRSKSPLFINHVWNGPKGGSFLKIDSEYYVCSPEACFVQMATKLPIEHLMELGFMLCGTYLPKTISARSYYGLEPLTSITKLERYLDRCKYIKGTDKAKRALKFIANGSASVMESRLFLLLCCSGSLGGYGLPKPELNAKIVLPSEYGARTATPLRYPDFLWKDNQISLEYDSRENHSTEAQRLADDRRRNELHTYGLTAYIAHTQDVYNPTALHQLAMQLKKALGHRRKSTQRDLIARQNHLYQMLLGEEQWELLSPQPLSAS